MMLIKTTVRPSPIHGLGLCSVASVPRGTPIWQFEPGFDHDFSPQQYAALPPLARDHIRWFCYVNRDNGHYILSGDHACFINHSASPNTGTPNRPQPALQTVALRDIAAGEEITCDYYAYDADTLWKLRGSLPSNLDR